MYRVGCEVLRPLTLLSRDHRGHDGSFYWVAQRLMNRMAAKTRPWFVADDPRYPHTRFMRRSGPSGSEIPRVPGCPTTVYRDDRSGDITALGSGEKDRCVGDFFDGRGAAKRDVIDQILCF